MYGKFGTHLKYSSSSHPQTDGQTKVTSRTLGNLLRCLSGNQTCKWDIQLAQAEFVYNNMQNRSTKKCPFEVVYTHSPRLTFDLNDVPSNVDFSEEDELMIDRIQRLHGEVLQYLESANAF